jgi:hypothetical protein
MQFGTIVAQNNLRPEVEQPQGFPRRHTLSATSDKGLSAFATRVTGKWYVFCLGCSVTKLGHRVRIVERLIIR